MQGRGKRGRRQVDIRVRGLEAEPGCGEQPVGWVWSRGLQDWLPLGAAPFPSGPRLNGTLNCACSVLTFKGMRTEVPGGSRLPALLGLGLALQKLFCSLGLGQEGGGAGGLQASGRR